MADLRTITFSNSARPIIAQGFSTKGSENLTRLVSAADAQQHFVKVSVPGQITTSISNCPRELQPHLLLNGELTASCDVSHAHWDFLPLILANRLRLSSGLPDREKYVADGWCEHDRLTVLLSEGDFYRVWCRDLQSEAERGAKKQVLNILLNKKNEECRGNRLYRRIVAAFPITFGAIEDIKRKDHRNLSKQLHRFLADAMAAALLELQQRGMAVIPHVDVRQYISSALLQLFCFIEHLEPFRGFHLRRISGREAWRRNVRVLVPLLAQVPFAFHIQL